MLTGNSIVAVTGLDGNAYESWKHQATNRMWLHDFLPKDLGGRVRIMTYGYDSDLQGTSASYGGILDFIRNLVQEVDSARREVGSLYSNLGYSDY